MNFTTYSDAFIEFISPNYEVLSPIWQKDLFFALNSTLKNFSLWISLIYPLFFISIKWLIYHPLYTLFIFTCIILYLTQRCIRKHKYLERLENYYNNIISKIHHQSRILALLFPHLLYIFIFILMIYFKIIQPVTSDETFYIFGFLIPLICSFYSLNNSKNMNFSLTYWLSYWIFFSFFILLFSIPFLLWILKSIYYFNQIKLAFIIWLSNPYLQSSIHLKNFIFPIISKYIITLPKTSKKKKESFILNFLKRYNILSKFYSDYIIEAIDGGLVVIFSLFFIFSPGFIVRYGCLLIGIAFPLIYSISSLNSKCYKNILVWLNYFNIFYIFAVIFSFFESYISEIPLIYHLLMIFILWLQLPYFRGALFLTKKILKIKIKENSEKLNNDIKKNS